MLELSVKNGISLTVCSFDTIEEMKENIDYIKGMIKKEKLTPTKEDIKKANECFDQIKHSIIDGGC